MSTLAQTSTAVNPAFDFSRQRVPVFGRTVLTLAAGDKVLWERSNARNMCGGYRLIKATVVSAKPGAKSVTISVIWRNGLMGRTWGGGCWRAGCARGNAHAFRYIAGGRVAPRCGGRVPLVPEP